MDQNPIGPAHIHVSGSRTERIFAQHQRWVAQDRGPEHNQVIRKLVTQQVVMEALSRGAASIINIKYTRTWGDVLAVHRAACTAVFSEEV